jgi:hypothetical protein
MEPRHPIIPILIDNFPHPAAFKQAGTGKYLGSNAVNAREFGVNDPSELLDLTIHDLSFSRQPWGLHYAGRIAELDRRVCEKKAGVKDERPFMNHAGEVRYYEIVKFPVLDAREDIAGIVTYAHDIQHKLGYREQYRLYRRFHEKAEAIQRFLAYYGLQASFPSAPSETQLMVLLEKAQGHSDKKIGKRMQLSTRMVERHVDEMRALINGNSLEFVLARLRRDTMGCEH